MDPQPGDAIAVIDHDGTRFDYDALRGMSDQLADLLTQSGLQGDQRLMLVCENCCLYAVAILAASKLDLWITLVNARQSEEELQAVIDHCDPAAVLFTTNASANAAEHAETFGARQVETFDCGDIVLTLRPGTPPEPVEDGADQVAALLYTTGTTSAPKGVMLTHDNLIFTAENSVDYVGLLPSDDVLCVLPGTHIYCFASCFLPAMTAGARVRFVPRFDPAAVLDHLRDGVSRFPAVPQMYVAIMELLDERNELLNAPALRRLATGGAPLDPDLKRKVEDRFGHPLTNGYGITECSPTVATTRTDTARSDVSVGHPVPNVEVIIHDPDPDGIGEIWVRGRNIMKGYYREPEKTAEVLTKDGYYRTGDLGRFDDDGALHIEGRSKELIIRSGFNVFPPEVEAMLTRHPDIIQAAVVGRKRDGDEEIVAFVKGTGVLDPSGLQDWLSDRLVGYKVPQVIVQVDDYPAAATGKILKHKLLAHFADQLDG